MRRKKYPMLLIKSSVSSYSLTGGLVPLEVCRALALPPAVAPAAPNPSPTSPLSCGRCGRPWGPPWCSPQRSGHTHSPRCTTTWQTCTLQWISSTSCLMTTYVCAGRKSHSWAVALGLGRMTTPVKVSHHDSGCVQKRGFIGVFL